jgi:flagellar biosynthesis/type III secretory pathway protein FliH
VKAKLVTEANRSSEGKKQRLIIGKDGLGSSGQTGMDQMRENFYRQNNEKSMQMEQEAMNKAEELLEEARVKSQELFMMAERNGHEEGYLRGLVDGANASCTAAEESLDGIKLLIDLIKNEKRELVKREEKALVELSFELAKKIMKQAVHLDDTIIEKMLHEVVLENEGQITIFMSEYQKTLDLKVDRSLAKKIRAFSKESKVVFIKEEDVVMVETESEIIDMSIPTQIDHLKKAMENNG